MENPIPIQNSTFKVRHSHIILLFTIAFFVRMSIALIIDTPITSDDSDYHEIGMSIANGKGFSLSDQPTALRPPGYPFFLALCYHFFVPSVIIVCCIQTIIDTITCLIFFLIAKHCFDNRIAFFATGILTLFPLHIIYIPRLLTETLFTSLFLLCIWLMVRHWNKNHAVFQILTVGIMLAVTTLVRPTAGILVFIAI